MLNSYQLYNLGEICDLDLCFQRLHFNTMHIDFNMFSRSLGQNTFTILLLCKLINIDFYFQSH